MRTFSSAISHFQLKLVLNFFDGALPQFWSNYYSATIGIEVTQQEI